MRVYFFIFLSLLALPLTSPAAPADKDDSTAKATSKTPSPPAKSAEPKDPAEADDAEGFNEGPDAKGEKRIAAVSTIAPEELANFDHYAPQIQQLIRNALELTKLNLTYTFGSSTPTQGGMDCSGTIFHLLQGLGIKGVPRQSDEMCNWVQDRTLLHRIAAADSLKHVEFSAMQPGDLLFWTGTYTSAPRKTPVTHVMLYLGKMKKRGKHVVFGSSDGRVYQGQRRTGVSVFDFTLPKPGGKSTFYGYGLIPGIGNAEVKPLDPITIAAANVDKVIPPAKEPLEAKDGIKPLKTEVAATPAAETPAAAKEEIRRAAPAAASEPAKKTQAATAAKKAPTPAKKGSTTKSKASSSPSTKKRTTAKRSPPPPPTARQKFENAASKVANSIRNALPD